MPNLIRSDGAVVDVPDDKVSAAIGTGNYKMADAPTSNQLTGPSDIPDEAPSDTALSDVPITPEEQDNNSVSIPKKGEAAPVLMHAKELATGKSVQIPESEATQAVLSGTHSITNVPLTRDDGALIQVPEEKVKQALATGKYRISTEDERERVQTQNVLDNQSERVGLTGLKESIGGPLDTGLGFAAKHAPGFGIANEFNAPEDKEQVQKNFDVASNENPISADVGSVVGEAASAYGLGKVASGATKALELSGLAKVGVEGAIYSAEPVIKGLINKDPAASAESLALGVGINYALHGLFSGINAAPEVIENGVQTAKEAVGGIGQNVSQEEAENLIGNKLFGLSPGKIAKNRNIIGPAMKAAKILGDDTPETALDKLQNLQDNGPAIGKTVKLLDSFDGKRSIIEDSLNKSKQDIEGLNSELKLRMDAQAAITQQENLIRTLSQKEEGVIGDYEPNPYGDNSELKTSTSVPETSHLGEDDFSHESKAEAEVKNENDLKTIGSWKDNDPRWKPYIKTKYKYDMTDDFDFGDNEGENEPIAVETVQDVKDRLYTKNPKKYSMFAERQVPETKASSSNEEYNPDPYEEKPKYPSKELEMEAAQKKLSALKEDFNQRFGNKLSPSETQMNRAIKPIMAEIDNTIKKGTFEDTQKLKQWIGQQTNFSKDNSFINTARKRVYGIVNENLQNAEDAVAKEIGSPEVMKGLQEARAGYTFFKAFGDDIDRQVAKKMPDSTIGDLLGSHLSHRALPAVVLSHFLHLPAMVGLGISSAAKLGKQYLEKQQLTGAFKKLLGESAQPATDVILHATQTQDKLISDSASNLIKSFVSTEAPKAISAMAGSQNAVKDFLPDGGAGLSHEQQLKQLRTMVNESSNDPAVFAQRMSKVTEPLIKEGLPEVAEAYTNHQLRLMKVIQTVIPADTSMAKAHPFSNNVEEPEISAATKMKYQKALSIASDPLKLLDMIKNNSITAGDVAIAAATNPSTLQKMRNALINEAMKSKPDLSYQHQLSLEIMMCAKIDESTDQVPILQGVYPPVAPLGSGPGGGGKSKGHMSAKSSDNIDSGYSTISQKSSGH